MKKIILALCLLSLAGCAKTAPVTKAQYLQNLQYIQYPEMLVNGTDFYTVCFGRTKEEALTELKQLYQQERINVCCSVCCFGRRT